MGLFDFLSRKSAPQSLQGDPNQPAGAITQVGAGGYDSADAGFMAWLDAGGHLTAATSSGIAVNENSAVTLSAVWACIRVIAESVAQLPLFVLEDTGKGGKRKAIEHPAYRLLQKKPNPRQTAFNFREIMIATCCLWGNAYAIIEFDALLRPIGLHWVHPRNVTVIEYLGELYYQILGEAKPRHSYEMLHVAGLGFNGVTGRSVLSVMRDNFGLGLSAQQYGSNFYNNGANVGGAIEHPNKLSKEALEKLRAQFNSQYSGLKNSHSTVILDEGMKYNRIGMPPADAQFLQTRDVQDIHIARGFRVPQHKIGILTRSTNNNIEHQGLEFVTDTIGPWLERFEQEVECKLLREDQKLTYSIKHNTTALLRGDVAARGQFYKDLFQAGVLSPNDICDMEDIDHVPDGDRRYVPLNMVPTDLLEKVLLKPATKRGHEKEPNAA
ncbi:phage portal protein [Hymenobacter sp. HD11105]